jgi:hypothetical protein
MYIRAEMAVANRSYVMCAVVQGAIRGVLLPIESVMTPVNNAKLNIIEQCFSTFVRPRRGKFFFHKTKARPNKLTRKYLSNFFLLGSDINPLALEMDI